MTTTCQCGQPTSGAWMCSDCMQTFRWSIANIPGHHADLDNVAGKATRYSGAATKGSIGKAQPLPIDARFAGELEDGSRLKAETRNTVSTWARQIMEDQPEIPGPTCADCIHISCAAIKRRRHPKDSVQSMCAYLARQFQLIVREQWCTDMFDEFRFIEQRLSRFVDRPAQKMYLGLCIALHDGEQCVGSVYANQGAHDGKCDQADCAATYEVAASRQGLEEALDSRLCTAAEIAHLSTYLGLKADRERVRKRINQWHKRSRITANGHNLDGDPTFTYGDVKALLFAEFGDTSKDQCA